MVVKTDVVVLVTAVVVLVVGCVVVVDGTVVELVTEVVVGGGATDSSDPIS